MSGLLTNSSMVKVYDGDLDNRDHSTKVHPSQGGCALSLQGEGEGRLKSGKLRR